jgi:allantoin racemase
MLAKAVEIEKRHDCDTNIIGCFADPGLLPLRQATSIPVLGIAEVCLNVAAMLGDKIAIIAPKRDFVYVFEKMIHTYQFSDHVVAVRLVEELDLEFLQTHPDKIVDSLADACLRAIHEDDADVVIPGCVGFFPSVVHQVRELIDKKGFRTPIMDCVTTAYHAAKMIVELGLNQYRRKL